MPELINDYVFYLFIHISACLRLCRPADKMNINKMERYATTATPAYVCTIDCVPVRLFCRANTETDGIEEQRVESRVNTLSSCR